MGSVTELQPVEASLLLEVVVTVGIAAVTAFLQLVMKGSSRPNPPGKVHALKIDDALFWSDWVLAAGFALASSALLAAEKGKTVPFEQLAYSFAAIVFGAVAFPFFLRIFAYDPSGTMKTWGWRGAGWVFVANSVGILILLGSVSVGVKVYA